MAVLLAPGEGRYREPAPILAHNEYPKHMAHPGYQAGKVGQEVTSPHGFKYHIGGEAIRFPPVLVNDADQEAYHAAQGYVSIGKSDPAAFARAVEQMAPPALDYKPAEYPKWIGRLNRTVDSAEQEAELLAQLDEAPAAAPPPVKTDEQMRIEYLEAELARLRGGPPAEVTQDLPDHEMEGPTMEEYAAMVTGPSEARNEPPLPQKIKDQIGPTADEIIAMGAKKKADDERVAMRAARAQAMRDGKARKKAEREAAAKAVGP